MNHIGVHLITRALRMFFTILPITNTGHSDTASSVIFQHGVLLLAAQCSPSFDSNWGNKTNAVRVGTNYTHNIEFSIKTNVSATHQIVWAGPLNSKIV